MLAAFAASMVTAMTKSRSDLMPVLVGAAVALAVAQLVGPAPAIIAAGLAGGAIAALGAGGQK
jgi:predicted branched-subunit amino acid permease